MKTFTKAFLIACAVELPQLALLARVSLDNVARSIPENILGWYHLPAIFCGYVLMNYWNRVSVAGPRFGSLAVYWACIFAVQVAITAVAIFLILRICREHAGAACHD